LCWSAVVALTSVRNEFHQEIRAVGSRLASITVNGIPEPRPEEPRESTKVKPLAPAESGSGAFAATASATHASHIVADLTPRLVVQLMDE